MINLELSPDRQQFANLFSVRVLAVMHLARHFLKMISCINRRLRRDNAGLIVDHSPQHDLAR